MAIVFIFILLNMNQYYVFWLILLPLLLNVLQTQTQILKMIQN
jgi:hypothetical protein